MHRGEIYLVDLGDNVGSEQSGVRPVLIVQNERGNRYSPTTIVCPLTTKAKQSLDTHLSLTAEECGIPKDSTVLCEQIRTIDKTRLQKKLGEISKQETINDLNKALLISMEIL